MTYLEEAYSWLAYADEALQAANDNSDLGHHGVAINRAYYAAFYAAKGVIAAARGRDPKSHSGVRIRFGELAVADSDFPPEVAGTLQDLSQTRGKTDYDLGYRESLTPEEAARSIAYAVSFVTEVRSWFLRRHPE